MESIDNKEISPSGARRWPRLLPREHGAWVQLLLPSATALVAGSRTAAPWLWTLAALAAFLAHEPLRIAVGHRGTRLRRDWAGLAPRMAAVALCVAAMSALAAQVLQPIAIAWLIAPAAAAVALAAIVVRQADRTLAGELIAAASLPWVALPVAVSGGAEARFALGQACVWSIGFTLLTLAVRAAKARALKQPLSRRLATVATLLAAATLLSAALLAHAAAVTAAEAIGVTLLASVAAALGWPRVAMRDFWRLGVAVSAVAILTSAVLLGWAP